MKLFEILSNDERIIVLSSQEDSLIYTWNQSVTFQVYEYRGKDHWEEIDIFCTDVKPETFAEARKRAQNYYNRVDEE